MQTLMKNKSQGQVLIDATGWQRKSNRKSGISVISGIIRNHGDNVTILTGNVKRKISFLLEF